ncbi:MAG: hypothetical protein P1R58_01855 [bacterium]|nr:hypothetical protein [bacterium]
MSGQTNYLAAKQDRYHSYIPLDFDTASDGSNVITSNQNTR